MGFARIIVLLPGDLLCTALLALEGGVLATEPPGKPQRGKEEGQIRGRINRYKQLYIDKQQRHIV